MRFDPKLVIWVVFVVVIVAALILSRQGAI
jgi:hypothetical protein